MKRQHWFSLCLALAMLVLLLSGCTPVQPPEVYVAKGEETFFLAPVPFSSSFVRHIDVSCLVKIKQGKNEITVTTKERLVNGEVKELKLQDIVDIQNAQIIDVDIQSVKIVSLISEPIIRLIIIMIVGICFLIIMIKIVTDFPRKNEIPKK